MFRKLQYLARKARSAVLAGRPVLARADIVCCGQYVPRGATGHIVRLRPDGDFDVAFDRLERKPIRARRHEVAPAPTLAPRGLFGLRIPLH